MFQERGVNAKNNHTQERAPKLAYQDLLSSPEELLVTDKPEFLFMALLQNHIFCSMDIDTLKGNKITR